MQADYAAYAKANGVLPMPAGYEPTSQVLTNAMVNVYVPRYRNAVLAALAGLVVLGGVIIVVRRRKGLRP
jgi:arylsulfatase/uncharacterized sulfatase